MYDIKPTALSRLPYRRGARETLPPEPQRNGGEKINQLFFILFKNTFDNYPQRVHSKYIETTN